MPKVSEEERKKRFDTWFRKPDESARQLKYFTQNKKLIKGEAISWRYIGELDCIAIRRRFGVQYFASVKDLRTLSHWDIRGIIMKKLMGAEHNSFVCHYVDMIVYEANTR